MNTKNLKVLVVICSFVGLVSVISGLFFSGNWGKSKKEDHGEKDTLILRNDGSALVKEGDSLYWTKED